MKVVEIRSEIELQAYRPAWDSLLQDSASDTIFLTWEWINAWWSAYGKSGDLRVLAAWDEDGKLRGIAPLCHQSSRKYGQGAAVYSFIGDGSNDSEYLDCIVATGYEARVMEAFRAHWKQDLERGVVLTLREIPATSVNLSCFQELAAAQGVLSKGTGIPCGTVCLPDKMGRLLEHAEAAVPHQGSFGAPRSGRAGASTLRILPRPQKLERMLPVLFDLHARRWKKDGMPGVFGWDRKRDFYYSLSPLLLKRGWLRFSWLTWNGQILACQYGFVYGGTYFHLQEGYEPACEHLSIGIGLRAWSIREFLKEGVREYDFLGGMGRHKSDWGAEAKLSRHIQIAKSSCKNLLYCRGPEWEGRARDSVKKILPKWLLSARRARLDRRAESGPMAKPSLLEWSQQGAANCYFHMRLPSLARSLRDHYQLSVSSVGRWPKFSWHRRREASARILYYHRVNDEGDPFFPAISTELFDREMQYIARHYNVVPLSELLNHLEGGTREAVLAITFDDGYEDNYQNAFPILKRYDLPATIFLTTGSVDSRLPLWFEQLAQALKRSPREHIDLEIDIPRRFQLTSTAARLQANGGIFALLRGLTDAERGEWLDRILKQLAVPDDNGRKGKMLTWDQVRQMKAQGIEFGGHTVTHPFLSKMTREGAAWEVAECKRRIEEELQFPVDYFAYPNGREEDFGEWNKEVLRSAGYRAALTTKWGLNYQSTDRMELRRGGPWEEDPALFAYKLDWYQLVNG